jgi:hypothetical protein
LLRISEFINYFLRLSFQELNCMTWKDDEKRFLTKDQAGAYAGGASRATVDRWIQNGLPGRPPLPALKVGRKVLIEQAILHDWLTGAPPVRRRKPGRPPKYFNKGRALILSQQPNS